MAVQDFTIPAYGRLTVIDVSDNKSCVMMERVSMEEMMKLHLDGSKENGIPIKFATDARGRCYVWPFPYKLRLEV